ncbi:hypothetical protein [Halpernia humi]|nr:hypothetical protein [Halpernia humi]
MKYLFLIAFSIISCKTNVSKTTELNKNSEMMDQQSTFRKSLSENNTYTLYYKIAENMNSPVKIFTYYVTDTDTGKMVKKIESIAAEKIYWKDSNTLAIIPYTEMIQKSDVVGEINQPNEILIKIK